MKIFISADIEGIAGVMRPSNAHPATRNISWPVV
jgi:D-aminopeptidase